jgi:hypothetical protein
MDEETNGFGLFDKSGVAAKSREDRRMYANFQLNP